MESVCFSETLASTQKSALHHNREKHRRHFDSRENLKPHSQETVLPIKAGTTGGLRRLHNSELHDLHNSPDIYQRRQIENCLWEGRSTGVTKCEVHTACEWETPNRTASFRLHKVVRRKILKWISDKCFRTRGYNCSHKLYVR